MRQRCYAIVGWFAQTGLRINTNPQLAVPQLYDGAGAHTAFSGLLTGEENEHGGTFTGFISDHCGLARVTATMGGEKQHWKLRFTKIYTHRTDEIKYDLTLLGEPGMNFRGHYEGASVGRGEAHAILHVLPGSFFE